MFRIVKTYKVIRNNWKKSFFFSGLAAWGAHFGYGKYLEFNLMKAYCQEASIYGNQSLSPMGQPRHVTVILNPVANKRKGKADFEKYCLPLFHLAGLKVSQIVTEEEGQAKDLMEIMDNTDCVVLAGGDGTVHEAITGLFRRPDSSNAIQRFPIGILPIGRKNYIAHNLNSTVYDSVKDKKVKILAESSMLVIQQVLSKADVMVIEGDKGRPIYTLGNVNLGQINNTIRKVDQYWYLGQKMKPYLTFFFQSFKDLTEEWDHEEPVDIEYTEPCSGCFKCFEKYEESLGLKSFQVDAEKIVSNQRWWHSFMPRSKPIVDPVIEEKRQQLDQLKQIINQNCDQWQSLKLNFKNLIIQNTLNNSVELVIHSSNLDNWSFIKEGIEVYDNQKPNNSLNYRKIVVKDCKIKIKKKQQDFTQLLSQNQIKGIDENFLNKTTKSTFILNETIEERPTAIKELDDINLQSKNLSSNETIDNNSLIETSSSTNRLADEENNRNNQTTDDIGQLTDKGIEISNDKQIKIKHNNDDDDDNNSNVNGIGDDNDRFTNSKWISIDNENYEMVSNLKINLLPKRIFLYSGHGGGGNVKFN